MVTCIECGIEYRTYIPEKDCCLSDGTVQRHVQPQDKCPDCDFTVIGVMLNKDKFPHLSSTGV